MQIPEMLLLLLTGQLAVLNLAKACVGLLFVYERHTVSVSRKKYGIPSCNTAYLSSCP